MYRVIVLRGQASLQRIRCLSVGAVFVCRSELGLGGIPTMNDDAVCLMDRIGCISGKHRSHRRAFMWDRPGGAPL